MYQRYINSIKMITFFAFLSLCPMDKKTHTTGNHSPQSVAAQNAHKKIYKDDLDNRIRACYESKSSPGTAHDVFSPRSHEFS